MDLEQTFEGFSQPPPANSFTVSHVIEVSTHGNLTGGPPNVHNIAFIA